MDKAPGIIRTFVDLGYDYNEQRTAGAQCYAECTFCGGRNKLYVNMSDGQWDCKSCGERGNVYTYMKMWYESLLEDQDNSDYDRVWSNLSKSRKIPVEVLKEAGLIYDGDLFFIPVLNLQGKLVNLRYYKLQTVMAKNAKKSRIFGLTGIDSAIYGLNRLSEKGRSKEVIYLCEGEWDAIALQWLLDREGAPGIVLGIPGSNTFKAGWEEFFTDRHVVMCYDHDTPGEQGLERVNRHLQKVVSKVQFVSWPVTYPSEYDIRDFVTTEGTIEGLTELVFDYVSPEEREKKKEEEATRVPISSKDRPSFDQVCTIYDDNILMTPDLTDILKIIFAVVLSTQIPGDPVWLHVIGPPGSGKTLLLVSTLKVASTYHLSKIRPKDLISGFIAKNGEDPSLIPRLDGKCLVVKDFTATTSMPSMVKEELYGTLRDAYDGDAAQDYANNVKRRYKSHFSILTGVTSAIYGERSDVLGARFIYLHPIKGNDNDSRDILSTVFDSTIEADGERMAEELLEVASKFLDVTITREDYPVIPSEYKWPIISLAEICAALRASVSRDVFHRNSQGRALKWRPQAEIATRLTKQFTKLALSLGLVTGVVGHDEYRLVARVAMDTCIGFNMEVVAYLIHNPDQDRNTISEACNIAKSTLDDQLEDLTELGAITTRRKEADGAGNRPYLYSASNRLVELWKTARLDSQGKHIKALTEDKKKFKVKRTRRKI